MIVKERHRGDTLDAEQVARWLPPHLKRPALQHPPVADDLPPRFEVCLCPGVQVVFHAVSQGGNSAWFLRIGLDGETYPFPPAA